MVNLFVIMTGNTFLQFCAVNMRGNISKSLDNVLVVLIVTIAVNCFMKLKAR